jgi:hypothetical protein
MGIKAQLSLPLARLVMRGVRKRSADGAVAQRQQFEKLVSRGAGTAFGRDHGLGAGMTVADFQAAVPVRDYEGLRPWMERAVRGEEGVVWPGKPLYFCKTSGTTSGAKYIPLTRESMPNHIGSARNALLAHIAATGNADFVDGKMIFLQGSPELSETPGGVPLGRLSGIVAHHVPAYLQRNRLPKWETNCIEDWEEKVEAIVRETARQDLRLISGIPSWVQMYFERLLAHTGAANVMEVFPNFSLFVYGGVAFEPYRERFRALIGAEVPTVELYPASEGFLAWQDTKDEEGLLLNVADGIFFEFIPADQYFDEKPPRLTLAEVEVGVQYAVVLTTNAGLWAYDIGDTVKFVSLAPPRIVVTGRIKHFTSAFGEHVIAEEVEGALSEALAASGGSVVEFHVAPQVTPAEGLPYHEWFVEFAEAPADRAAFAAAADAALQRRNPYYRDLITGSVLRPAVLQEVAAGAFNEAMRALGRLGGQNKPPRLANDRTFADALTSQP